MLTTRINLQDRIANLTICLSNYNLINLKRNKVYK